MLRRIIVFLLCMHAYTAFVSAAGHNHKKFHHITVADGLSQNRVTSILKSTSGYYWFATYNGLNRYDGYEIKTYRFVSDNENSLSSNRLVDIVEDQYGSLWVATLAGLNQFDPKTERFNRYTGVGQGIDDHYYSIAVDGDQLWLAVEEGLGVFDIVTKAFTLVWESAGVHDIVVTEDALWLSSSKGLVRYVKSSREITHYYHPLESEFEHSPNSSSIQDLLIYQHDLWVATKYGVFAFDLRLEQFDYHKQLLPGKNVNALLADAHGQLWLGTNGFGLFVYSLLRKDLVPIVSSKDDPYRLRSNLITELFYDGESLWVGHAEGVSHVLLASSVGFMRASNSSLLDNHVFRVVGDHFGGLWVGTGRGVTYIKDDLSDSYQLGEISDIHINGGQVIVSGRKGVFEFDVSAQKFNRITESVSILKNKSDQSVFSVVEIKSGEFFLATTYGLVYWNRKANESYIVKDSDKLLPAGTDGYYGVLILKKTSKGILLGTFKGLYFIKSGAEVIERYLLEPKKTLLDQAEINEVYIAPDEVVWASTSKGLFSIDKRKIDKHYSQKDNMPDDIIRSAFVYDDVLWVSSDNGLSVYNIYNAGLKQIFLNNDEINVEYNERGVYFDRTNGKLYFPSMEGLVYFDVSEFRSSVVPPKTRITNVQLFNQDIMPGTKKLPLAVGFADRIIFNHNESMLTFEFSSLNVRQTDHLYAYQLWGLSGHDDWIVADSRDRRVTFTPGPGEYRFRVKSGWAEGAWSDEVAEIKVTVLPPWWLTNWAYLAYAVLFLFSMFAYIRIRISTLSNRARQLKKLVRERTKELEKSNKNLYASNLKLSESHQQIEVLLKRKNILLANTSHELRTPLTLILGPLNELLKSNLSDKDRQSVSLVKRNAERLAHMVDQLLALARANAHDQKAFTRYNFSEILSQLVHSLNSLLQEHSIQLNCQLQERVMLNALPDALEIIALNLIGNAIKYTEAGGTIDLSLCAQGGHAQFIVKDTGIGIAKSEQNTVFEQFTRLDNARQRNVSGSGIGLALVKELIELHKGQIQLHSELGQGSTFTVRIPQDLNGHITDAEPEDTDVKLNHVQEAMHLHFPVDGAGQDLYRSNDAAIEVRPQAEPNKIEKPKLLIVDDTQDLLEYLEQLASPFYECVTATNGRTALEIAENDNPDLILCDVMMPGIDGFEVLEAVRENIQTCHIPLILLTAKGDKVSRLKGLDAQVDDYISKPFDADELLARMDNLIKSRARLRQYFVDTLMKESPELLIKNTRLVKKDQAFVDRFHAYIQENYHHQELPVSQISVAMNLSESSLQKKLKALTGMSPISYLNQYRLQQACQYLRETQLPIQIIVEKVGFSDVSNFGRMFKKQFGKSPRAIRA